MSVSLDDIITRLAKRKGDLKKAQDKVKGIEEEIDEIKREYIAAALKLGVTEARNKTHSAAVVEKTIPHVVDWPAFYEFIKQNDFFHLLQKRPSTTGCEELFAQGEIPGVEKFKKVDVSLRSV